MCSECVRGGRTVDTSGFGRAATAELEVIFLEHGHDRRVLLALHEALAVRSRSRAKRLRDKVREKLASPDQSATPGVTTNVRPKSWYRRGVALPVAGVIFAGVAQGICHAVGFHLWEPIWNALQHVV